MIINNTIRFCIRNSGGKKALGQYFQNTKKQKPVKQISYIWQNCPSMVREKLRYYQINKSWLIIKFINNKLRHYQIDRHEFVTTRPALKEILNVVLKGENQRTLENNSKPYENTKISITVNIWANIKANIIIIMLCNSTFFILFKKLYIVLKIISPKPVV